MAASPWTPVDESAWTPVAESAPAAQPVPTGSISAGPTGIKGWLNQLEGDVKYGSDTTMPGKLLKFLGAQGTQVGAQAGAGDTLASPITGPIHTAQGLADIPQHPLAGALKAASGALETASIPAAFMSPEIAKGVAELPPSKSYASSLFSQLMSKLGSTKADISEPMQVAQEIIKAKAQGGQMPTVVRAFLKRAADAENPADYEFIRGLYSNASKLSANEYSRLNPNTQRLVGQFTAALGRSAQAVADQSGMGPQLLEAMKNYRQASQVQNAAKMVGKAAAAGAGVYGTERIISSAVKKATGR